MTRLKVAFYGSSFNCFFFIRAFEKKGRFLGSLAEIKLNHCKKLAIERYQVKIDINQKINMAFYVGH